MTCEGAFSYLARDAGLREVYIWAVNAEQQATPQQLTKAIEFVKANQVPAVFCESTVSDAPMRQVVGATGSTFGPWWFLTQAAAFAVVYLFSPRQGLIGTRLAKARRKKAVALAASCCPGHAGAPNASTIDEPRELRHL